jgi:hypothetical protein
MHEFVQDDESVGQDKSSGSRLSPIQSYALQLLENNNKSSECLSLAEAPPTLERLHDFGILIMPDKISEVIIHLNTDFYNLFICLNRYLQLQFTSQVIIQVNATSQ